IYGQAHALYQEIDNTLYTLQSSEKIEDPAGEDRIYLRDYEYEQDRIEQMKKISGLKILDSTPQGRVLFEASSFYDTIEELSALSIAIYSKQKKLSTPQTHRSVVKQHTDWFEIKTEIQFDQEGADKNISLDYVLKNKLKGPLESLG